MVEALRASSGYDVHTPEGTFYLAALADGGRRGVRASAHGTRSSCCPVVIEIPGQFRISLTGNDEMVERGLRGFAVAIKQAQTEKLTFIST